MQDRYRAHSALYCMHAMCTLKPVQLQLQLQHCKLILIVGDLWHPYQGMYNHYILPVASLHSRFKGSEPTRCFLRFSGAACALQIQLNKNHTPCRHMMVTHVQLRGSCCALQPFVLPSATRSLPRTARTSPSTQISSASWRRAVPFSGT